MDSPDPDHGTVVGRVLNEAGRRGLHRAVDLVSAESADYSTVKAALPEIDLLICNELEAERVTGVVLHVPGGACARSAAGEFVYRGSARLDDEFIVGAVGAGDAFAASVLLGLHEREPMGECLRFGVGCAAACLQDSTTSRGVRPISECLAIGDHRGYHSNPT